ncbi:hypothetical protein [uncultured Clostridium sp.]|uniref:hypothetical protein n=1 Tax=uncultured Clostridium sp. TaxID=59620 RepID=UPI00261D4221|nr:hypothetical protein [uncultured Clostridium sp.]
MGTNYYMIERSHYNLEKKIDKILGKQDYKTENENFDNLREKVKSFIIEEHKGILDLLKKANLEDMEENYIDSLDDAVNKFVSDIRYSVTYALSLREHKTKHIGKSSLGWLFNFQDQDEWHSYEQFKNFILDKEKFKDKVIIDEYGEEITPEKLIEIIDTKQNDKRNQENPDNFTYCRNVNGYRFSSGDFS